MADIRKEISEKPNAKGIIIEVLFNGNEVNSNIHFKNIEATEIIGVLEVIKQKFIDKQMKSDAQGTSLEELR